MPKFHFKFEAVLRQRKAIEQQRQRDLAAVLGDLIAVEAEITQINLTVKDVTNDVRSRLVGRLDLNFLIAHRRFMLGMQRKGMELVQRLTDAQQKVDESRTTLAEAAKQRRVMEKLRERHFEQWKAALTAKETAEMDEIGMQLNYWHGAET